MRVYDEQRGVLLMTMADWKATHRDSKGSGISSDGKRYRTALWFKPTVGTCLVPVEIVKETTA